MSRVAGVVLAAGAGSRMGTPKGELVIDGERLLDRAVRTLRDGGCDPVVAVVRDGVHVDGAVEVVNPDPGRGMRSSLELALPATDADALAVLLVDVPGVGADAVAGVVGGWRPGRVAIASYRGRRGHPTVMSAALWREALAVAGPDEGARAFLRTRPELVDEIEVPGLATDLDTPADVERWRARPR